MQIFHANKYGLNFNRFLFVFGIGASKSRYISSFFGLKTQNFKVLKLSHSSLSQLRKRFEGDLLCGLYLRRVMSNSISMYKLNGSYTGCRLKAGLPANGQRTRSNHRTSKLLRLF